MTQTVIDTASIDALNTAAIRAIIKVARRQELLTADDVLAELNLGPGASTRFLSAVFTDSRRSDLIQKTDRFQRSTRTGGPLTVWQSRLFHK